MPQPRDDAANESGRTDLDLDLPGDGFGFDPGASDDELARALADDGVPSDSGPGSPVGWRSDPPLDVRDAD